MRFIDQNKLEETVIRITRNVCSNLQTRYDDEYLSIAFEIAAEAIATYNPDLTDKNIYRYVAYCIYKTLKRKILSSLYAMKRFKELQDVYIDPRQPEPVECDNQQEIYADLVQLNRTRTARGNNRKREHRTRELLAKLRKKYSD